MEAEDGSSHQPGPEHRLSFEEALNKTGFGLYSYFISILAALLVISMVFSAYSLSIIIPASACELGTTVEQQGILAMVPLIGTFATPYLWGYLADTKGRKKMLTISVVLGTIFCKLAVLSPNWIVLMVLMLNVSAATSGMFALAMTLLSESIPAAKRNPMMLLVSSMFLLAQGLMAVIAIPIIPINISIHISFLNIYLTSWRLLLYVYSIPCVLCLILLSMASESPKFLLSQGNEEEALKVLQRIYKLNNRNSVQEYQVKSLAIDEISNKTKNISIWKSLKLQTVPLWQPPLLKDMLLISTLFVIVYGSCNSFMVWLPTVANNFINSIQQGGGDGLTLCQVLNSDYGTSDGDSSSCALNNLALTFVFTVGAIQSTVNALMSLIVNKAGRRNIIICLHIVAGISGICVNFITNSIGSMVLFVFFLITIVSIGLVTAVCISLFPTHLKAMALSLGLLFGRVSSTVSVQLVNMILANNCELAFYIFGSISACGALAALMLPRDSKAATKIKE